MGIVGLPGTNGWNRSPVGSNTHLGLDGMQSRGVGSGREVRLDSVIELLEQSSVLLRAAWRETTPPRALALVVSTLATHGRMMRYLATLETMVRVDTVGLARMRWALGNQAEGVRTNAGVPPIAIKRCHQYIESLGRELRSCPGLLRPASTEGVVRRRASL